MRQWSLRVRWCLRVTCVSPACEVVRMRAVRCVALRDVMNKKRKIVQEEEEDIPICYYQSIQLYVWWSPSSSACTLVITRRLREGRWCASTTRIKGTSASTSLLSYLPISPHIC